MFSQKLKKDALAIHQNAVSRYNTSHQEMTDMCQSLYDTRESAVLLISSVEVFINTIAHTPKEFEKKLGEIHIEMQKFHQTKEYAKEAYHGAVKSGINIVSGLAAGSAVAAAAPSVAMSIATTFGTASTGTAISTLSGAAAQKAALAWIGRVTGGIATKGAITGAGMASGQAFLALAGPIGWGVTAAATTISLVSLNSKNKKISEEAISEAKHIMEAMELLRETTSKVLQLEEKTASLQKQLKNSLNTVSNYKNMNYQDIPEGIQFRLGAILNNTNSLAALLNTVVE